MNELAERAKRIAAGRQDKDAQQLARIRDENPIFARMVDDLKVVFGGTTRVAYLSEPESGLQRGETAEERAKRDTSNGVQGLGVSVPASWSRLRRA